MASRDESEDGIPEELDDEEFQLPTVEDLPTLESILNEEDLESISDTELDFLPASHTKNVVLGDSGDTTSVHSRSSDSRSKTSFDKYKRPKREALRKSHGSILRHVVLKGIATQLLHANERVEAGLPTTMDVGNVICIGTSHGLILVFEHSQVLKFCLGSIEQRDEYGGVSAVAMNQDSCKLLVGYSKGHVCLYDLTNGKLLQNIPEAHTPHTAVLHIKWTDCVGVALLSDSGGSVYEVSMKRVMAVSSYESRCIFSGSRGEVCTLEPLNMSPLLTLPPVVDTLIVAMATISKVIVMSLRPHLKVHFSRSLPSSKATLPLIAWQFVIIQMPNGSKLVDPVLAFGRDSTLYFYQLTHGSGEELVFILLQEMPLTFTIQSMVWLNSRLVALMDTSERLHVIDVKSKEQLDRVDLAKLALVYATPHFKALSTGSNVSKAMAACGERACYHSMKTLGAQVLLLGTKSFEVVTVRNWSDRLNHLVKTGNIRDALQLALDILQHKAHGIIGLTQNKDKRKQLVGDKIASLLQEYLSQTETQAPPRDNLNKLISYYQQFVPPCVKVAVESGFEHLLFTSIWDTFSADAISRGIFLECLEPYILDDRLQDISPSITQCLLSHYEQKDKLEALEACIVHLPIPSLDLHQTMTLCWAHGLYDAILYVYTQGILDYLTPLEELVTVLKNAMQSDTLSQSQVCLGNKLLVYVSSCLAGRGYPRGHIPPAQIQQVKHEVFKCITTQHAKNPQELPYPYLRTLLLFDTTEFLNVLSLAFEEAEFSSELGLVQRRRVIDILLEIMTSDAAFTCVQLASLFTFIARQICKHKPSPLFDEALCQQVIEYLTCTQSESYHQQRETALLDLLQHTKLPHTTTLLQRAQDAKFYRVCEFIYESSGEHEKILCCYTQDHFRKHQSFNYITTVLTSKHASQCHKKQIQQQILLQIKDLLDIDASELAQLVLTLPSLWSLIGAIAEHIASDPEASYQYLWALFTCRASMTPSDSFCDDILYPELQEQLIRLMAQLDPVAVHVYLKDTNGYRLPQTLQICEEYQLDEATAYLMEKKGNMKAAFDIYARVLDHKVKQLIHNIEEEDEANTCLGLGHISLQVTRLMRVCENGSRNGSDQTRRHLWFPLLDLILSLQPKVSSQPNVTAEVGGLIGSIVNSMMNFISLPAILERIMKDSSSSDCSYGQIKRLLQDMIQRYTYESTLYSTVVKMLRKDQLKYIGHTKQHVASPLAFASTQCLICSAPLTTSDVVAFSCAHIYHRHCASGEQCALCNPHLKSTNQEEAADQVSLTTSQLDGLSKMTVLDDPVARWSCTDSPSLRPRQPRTQFYAPSDPPHQPPFL